jgi:DNA-binding MarR family transcriptional regulator
MHRVVNAILEQHGVTADQFVLLRTLAEEEGVIQKELASRLSLDQNTVTGMIRLLENQKIIRRRIVKHDARARAVYLTVRGRKVLEALIAKSEGFHRTLDQFLPPDQMDVLLRGLALIPEVVESLWADVCNPGLSRTSVEIPENKNDLSRLKGHCPPTSRQNGRGHWKAEHASDRPLKQVG